MEEENKMRKLLLMAVVVLGMAACEKYDDTILVNKVDALEITVADLQAQIDDINAKLDDEVKNLEALIAAVEDLTNEQSITAHNNLQHVYSKLLDVIAQLEAADASNAEAVAQALAAVAEVEDDLLTALENNINEVKEALASLGVADSNLEAQIDALINDLTSLQSTLNQETVTLEELIEGVKQTLDDANDAIQVQVTANTTAISTLTESLTVSLTSIETTIRQIDNRLFSDGQQISGLMSQVQAIQAAIDSLPPTPTQEDVDAIEEDIDALEGDVEDIELRLNPIIVTLDVNFGEDFYIVNSSEYNTRFVSNSDQDGLFPLSQTQRFGTSTKDDGNWDTDAIDSEIVQTTTKAYVKFEFNVLYNVGFGYTVTDTGSGTFSFSSTASGDSVYLESQGYTLTWVTQGGVELGTGSALSFDNHTTEGVRLVISNGDDTYESDWYLVAASGPSAGTSSAARRLRVRVSNQ